jgi:formate dehydrogenase accessory protein FdhD
VSDDPGLALLALLAERDGVSLPAAAKRLGLRHSELKRLLTALGDDAELAGMDLVRTRVDDSERVTLWLTAAGRALVASASVASRTLSPAPLPGGEGNRALHPVTALRVEAEHSHRFDDAVIVETPVALLYNGLAYAVMLATPTDLEDFALGFSLSEGIVGDAREWRLLERVDGPDGITLDMAIPQACADPLDTRRRALAGRSGCGLCGVESLQAALPPVAHVPRGAPVPVAAVRAALAQLEANQPLNHASGGVHAAAVAHAGGLLVREDVGRHNALDKVLGARARAGLHEGFVLVTSRASYELVHKAAAVGVGLLVAISAPTALAVRLAEEAGITLVAFARGEAMTVYTHPEGLN